MRRRNIIAAAMVAFVVASILTLCAVLSGGSGLSSPPAESAPQSALGREAIVKGYTQIEEETSETNDGVVMDSVVAHVGQCRVRIVLHHLSEGDRYGVSAGRAYTQLNEGKALSPQLMSAIDAAERMKYLAVCDDAYGEF